MKVAIVTDSNSGISIAEGKELGVTVIPMPFLIDGEEYFEEVTLSREEYYKKLLSGSDVSTSQPNIYSVMDLWTELLKTHDQVVYIPMSSGLSGSCETATNFAKEFDGKVQVVDNVRISVTQKQSVFDALKLAKEGKTAQEIKEFLEATKLKATIYILVSTLKYLKKGGRLTPAVAAIGTLLRIKPVLQIQGAKLDKYAMVMATSVGKKKMIEQVKEDIFTRFKEEYESGKIVLAMAHTNAKDKCEEFKKEVEEAFAPMGLKVEMMDELSLSVSSHIGDGSIALVAMYKY